MSILNENTYVTLNNGKPLDIPTFFTISNLGGGGADKYRETSYINLYGDTPILFNYYYLWKQGFARQELKELERYPDFRSFLKFAQQNFLDKGYSFEEDKSTLAKNEEISNILLLDSGASNFINHIISEVADDSLLLSVEYWKETLWDIGKEYYDFAHDYEFDMVIGFDTGGKYTFKGVERTSGRHINVDKYIKDNAFEINKHLIWKTAEYLQDNEDFYPSLYMTLHGTDRELLKQELEYLHEVEDHFQTQFFGIAIGGIASSKYASKSWFSSLEHPDLMKYKNTYLATKATQIVAESFPNRPIHILGGGGYSNIIPATLAGATSADSQTPGRRAYDGSGNFAEDVYDSDAAGTFSKYMVGLLDENLDYINNTHGFSYEKLNTINDSIDTPNFTSKDITVPIRTIKELYSEKNNSQESWYLSRQLINLHSIYQHKYLCELVYREREGILDYCKASPNPHLVSYANLIEQLR